MHSLFLFITLSSLVLRSHGAPRNVTVDDTDPMIVCAGNWDASNSHISTLDFNGSHALSSDPSASATLSFTVIVVYFLSPRWPYLVNSTLTLDGEDTMFVNLTDPEAAPTNGGPESERNAVHWSRTGLDNKTHEVVVSMTAAGQWVVLDGFIYTVNDHENDTGNTAGSGSSTVLVDGSSSLVDPASSASASASASTAAAGSANNTSGGISALAIGLGVSFSVLVTLGCIGTCLICRRRRLCLHDRVSPQSNSVPILYGELPPTNAVSRPTTPFFVANPDEESEGTTLDMYMREKNLQRRVVLEDVMVPPPAYSV
ncbi:uncharacterized protein EV420DRAFT_1768919 [Desarmillaria tabescens]|uniref:Mid2 domain-containing protein n=1 Tax=Armillaria tabescens TaxID=1929756 RepID=A0AA39MQG1_ARMTA|nr:uncharacterized protein EV420DRAFT_1768919 [Desarmillaria tabescens]KAK0442025.1 hypothetical protein EV420DRAFT_1768919 [Desarmillaria tabescens]